VPDPRVERERQKALSSLLDRIAPFSADTSPALLATTITVASYPNTAGAFFAFNPTEIDGNEVEGGAASYTVDPTQVGYALNAGSQIPPVGTRVVAHAVGGRWVFRYDG
jgi:hypothetical protein